MMPETFIRAVARDNATGRLGHVMSRDREHGLVIRVWMRPVSGGREWAARPENVELVSIDPLRLSAPQETRHASVVLRCSAQEVQTVLWGLSIRDDFVLADQRPRAAVVAASADEAAVLIAGGVSVVEVDGRRFEVTEPEWSIEQDVYGCEDGRDCHCPELTDEVRARFEAMIAARFAELEEAGQGDD